MNVLDARSVTVRFSGLVALSGVSLSVGAGETVGLVGPNGAGKSTLFNVLSGHLRPTAGSVWLGGHDVTGASSHHRAHAGLARTFQRPEVFATLTVRQHLQLAYRARERHRRVWTDMLLAPSRWRRDDAEHERVETLLDLLDLQAVAERRVSSMPLGTVRQLELARALVGGPDVLLLDEPSSGLGPRDTAALGAALVRARETEGVSILLVEHDMELVMNVSGRMYVLDFGELIAEGTPAEIQRSDEVRASYLGAEVAVAKWPGGTRSDQ